MIRMLRTTILFMLGVAALLPGIASAQQGTETTTFQVNFTTPGGNKITGTVVADRMCNANEANTDLTFNGMINGTPRSYEATVIERWLGDGREEIEVVSHNWPGTVLDGAVPSKFTIVQTSPGLITAYGIPMALSAPFQAPCSGQTSYIVTNPGQGSQPISQLPNTGAAGLLFHPFVMTGLLILAGMVLITASWLLRDPRTQRGVESSEGI